MHKAHSEHSSPRDRRAFTLLELLVSVGIIAILLIILLPVIVLARRHARDATCKSNLSQIWKAMVMYANNSNETLFVNYSTPLRISNVVYKEQRATGLGCLYPAYLPDYSVLFCTGDPVRGPEWFYGWDNWETEEGEVQCSYGYRGRQNLVADVNTALTISELDSNPQKVAVVEFYETFTSPARVNHPNHINFLRCNGQVEQAGEIVSFGPNPEDFQHALDVLDR